MTIAVSSSSSSSSTSSGFGFFGLLTVAFIVLKLTGYINWSWLWVLAPLWLPVVAMIGFLIVLFVGAFIFFLLREFCR